MRVLAASGDLVGASASASPPPPPTEPGTRLALGTRLGRPACVVSPAAGAASAWAARQPSSAGEVHDDCVAGCAWTPGPLGPLGPLDPLYPPVRAVPSRRPCRCGGTSRTRASRRSAAADPAWRAAGPSPGRNRPWGPRPRPPGRGSPPGGPRWDRRRRGRSGRRSGGPWAPAGPGRRRRAACWARFRGPQDQQARRQPARPAPRGSSGPSGPGRRRRCRSQAPHCRGRLSCRAPGAPRPTHRPPRDPDCGADGARGENLGIRAAEVACAPVPDAWGGADREDTGP